MQQLLLWRILGAIFIPVMQAVAQPLNGYAMHFQKCGINDGTVYDMTYSGIFLVACVVVLNVLLILFFKPKYRRLDVEKEAKISNKTEIKTA